MDYGLGGVRGPGSIVDGIHDLARVLGQLLSKAQESPGALVSSVTRDNPRHFVDDKPKPGGMLADPPHDAAALKDSPNAPIKVVHLEVLEVLIQNEFHCHISHQSTCCRAQVHRLLVRARKTRKSITELVDLFSDDPLAPGDVGLGEEGIQRSAALLVQVVVYTEHGRELGRKSLIRPPVLVPPSGLDEELLKISWVVNVQLVRTDPHDRA